MMNKNNLNQGCR